MLDFNFELNHEFVCMCEEG